MPVKDKKIGFKKIVHRTVFASNFIAILLLFSSFLSWNVSTLKSNLFSYLGLGFGIILLINILYLLFWILLLKWKEAIICIVALLLCSKPITAFFALNIYSQKPPDNAIKVLTYNVQGFPKDRKKDIEEYPILEYIKETDADIVCIQEYLISKTGHSYFRQQDVDRILNKYPYRSISSLEFSGKYHIFGLACFSKYPIEKTERIKFKSSYNGAAVYTINIDGKKYSVANVHLESNRIKAKDKQLYNDFLQNRYSVGLETITSNIRNRLGRAYGIRAKQVEMVKQFIDKEETQGVIICGDFNDTPISYCYHQMKKGLVDSYASTAFGTGITYYEDLFRFRIDYIMHSKNMRAYRAKVDKVKYSDHYPLKTWIELDIEM